MSDLDPRPRLDSDLDLDADLDLDLDRRGESFFAPLVSHLAMPIYEYACAPCGKSFEELVIRKSDEEAVRCPTCGGADVSRQMSRPAAARVGAGAGPSRAPAPACGPVG